MDETTYDWVDDSKRSWLVAIETLRADYLANRKDGETAKEYLERRKTGEEDAGDS